MRTINQFDEMAMKTQSDFPSDVFVSRYMGSYGLSFNYCDESGREYRAGETSEDGVHGYISSKLDPKANVWVIKSVETAKGWGPLLYELLMESASLDHDGLTCDRELVSPEAVRVWQQFLKRGDVEKLPLPSSMKSKLGEFANYSYIKRPATRLQSVISSGKMMPVRTPDNQFKESAYPAFAEWMKNR